MTEDERFQRMIRSQKEGVDVCLTVTHLDSLVMARSGFHHSVNYRAVMAFGKAHVIDDPEEKLKLMDRFIDRGRADALDEAAAGEHFEAVASGGDAVAFHIGFMLLTVLIVVGFFLYIGMNKCSRDVTLLGLQPE